ncbi:MAG: DUF177 domain-containing protein [Caulobacteraceae bacterium]
MSPTPPWVRVITWAGARAGGPVSLAADTATRARVATFLDLETVVSLLFEARPAPWMDGAQVMGRLNARVIRRCGITLEPFEEAIDESVEVRFVPPGSASVPAPSGEEIIDIEADDPPEVAGVDGIDLGALAVETLALALAPFPRAPGAVYEPPEAPSFGGAFAILGKLRGPAGEA